MTKEERYAGKQRRNSERNPGKKRIEKIRRRKYWERDRRETNAKQDPVYRPLPSAQSQVAPSLLSACLAARYRVRGKIKGEG